MARPVCISTSSAPAHSGRALSVVAHLMKIFLSFLLAAAVSVSTGAESPAPKHPSFQLDAKAKRVMVEKAVALKPGDSYQSVTNRLGTPTYDQALARKEDSHLVGRSLKYYVVRWETGLVNEFYDELVDVFLDEEDRVRSVSIRVTLE
jgi:hypothetical protein